MVHVWPEFAFSGTHGRVPAMVRTFMAHVGREFAGSRTLRPHVYRRGVTSAHMRGEFAGLPRTGGRRVPPRRPPVLTWPEFRATVQTRRRRVPAPGTARTREARVHAGHASSQPMCTGAPRAPPRRPLQTRGRSVPTPIASVLVWPEFTDPLQTRRGCVPADDVQFLSHF